MSGTLVVRWEMRYGHLPAMYRLDEARGVFARRGERSLRWQAWEVGRVHGVRVREVRLRGCVLGVLLIVVVDGKREVGVFGRKDREAVEAFAWRVRECAAGRSQMAGGSGAADVNRVLPVGPVVG